jgi:hypothetical protein
MAWADGKLKFRPSERFGDGFSEPTLNTSKWTIVRNTGHVAVEAGELRIYAATYQPRRGLVESVAGAFPPTSAWIAEFKLRFDQIGFIGGGGGFSVDTAPSTDTSAAAVYCA